MRKILKVWGNSEEFQKIARIKNWGISEKIEEIFWKIMGISEKIVGNCRGILENSGKFQGNLKNCGKFWKNSRELIKWGNFRKIVG